MKPMNCLCLFCVLLLSSAGAETKKYRHGKVSSLDARGVLVIVGGGTISSAMYSKMIELAGGRSARVFVIPQASAEDPKIKAAGYINEFKKARAASAAYYDPNRMNDNIKHIENADLIWLGGGTQQRLVERLKDTKIPALLRARYIEGCVIAGSSAGAAVMSKKMISGKSALRAINGNSTDITEGLGFLPHTFIDQHFHKRQRFNRLISAVLQYPAYVGIGIDESTGLHDFIYIRTPLKKDSPYFHRLSRKKCVTVLTLFFGTGLTSACESVCSLAVGRSQSAN